MKKFFTLLCSSLTLFPELQELFGKGNSLEFDLCHDIHKVIAKIEKKYEEKKL
jgi:hypothetical protein